MKKGIYTILAMLAVCGMFIAGCDANEFSSFLQGYERKTPYMVIFDSNHDDQSGYQDASPRIMSVIPPAKTLGSLPTEPTRANNAFVGWYYELINKTATGTITTTTENFTASTEVNRDITVKARWISKVANEFFVSFVSGGVIIDKTATKDQKVNKFPSSNLLLGPSGYYLSGWWTKPNGEAGGGREVLLGYPPGNEKLNENITVYAYWEAETPGSYFVTFNMNDGSGTSIKRPVVKPADTIDPAKFPTDPERPGYTFKGWFTTQTGGTLFNAQSKVTANITVFAQWTQNAPITVTEKEILGVTPPAAGATPVTSPTGNTQYTAAVVWKTTIDDTPLTGTFAASTAYTATITLTAATGYTFSGVSSGFGFTVSGAATVTNAAGSGATCVVTALFLLPVTIKDIQGVTAPVTGAAPVTEITPCGEYTGKIQWSGSPTTFASSTAYTATITLTAASGYTFSGVGTGFGFTVNGADTVSNAAGTSTTCVVTAVFPETDAVADNPVTIDIKWDEDLGSLIDPPTDTQITQTGYVDISIAATITGYTVIGWYVDNVVVADSSGSGNFTGSTYRFSSNDTGTHNVTLVILKDGELYNTTVPIKVQ